MPPHPQKSPPRPAPIPPILWTALYAAIIAAFLALTAQYALRLLAITPEFAQAGDFFGYFQMAQDLRTGAAPNNGPRFTFDSPHARLLLDYLKTQNLPLDSYRELLAPNAYHYQPQSGLIANQYPPGVPWLLSLFPKDSALHIADYITLAALLAFPACILILTLTRYKQQTESTLPACGFAALAAAVGLMMFGISVSFSIDLFCLPLLCIFLCIHFAIPRHNAISKIAALLAGAFFGYAITCRLAAALFLPGFLLLLCPPRFRLKLAAKPALFLLGAIACGIIPLLIHQSRLTGSPFIPTYINQDAAAPTLNSLLQNAAFYTLGAGNLFFLTLLIAAACFYIIVFRRPAPGQSHIAPGSPGVTHPNQQNSSFRKISHAKNASYAIPPARPHILTRYAQAIALFIAVPTAYFLTHPITTDYYQLPTILVCLFAMAFGSLTLLNKPQHPSAALPRPDPQITAILATILAATLGWQALTLSPLPTAAQMRPPSIALPAILQNPNAWIFGDRFTGTLWYYHRLPSSTILHSTPEARLKTAQFIFHRHEPQLLLYDNPALDPILEELKHWGATLTPAGAFGNRPIFQIQWPPTGPKDPTANPSSKP